MKSKLFYLVKYVGWIYNLYFFWGILHLNSSNYLCDKMIGLYCLYVLEEEI